MAKVEKLGVILRPTKRAFESRCVLNPATYREGNYVHLFYRAVNNKHQSAIGYAKLEGPLKVIERKETPIIKREFEYESTGVEDPRIVKLGKTFYMTYVAHDGKNAITALATSKDLSNFEKKGIITPRISYDKAEDLFRTSKLKDKYFFFEAYYKDRMAYDVLLWDKDVFLFPQKIKSKYALINRILPDIQIVYFKEFKELASDLFWRKYLRQLSKYVVLENRHWYESRNIGGGCPPIKTRAGWLLIYHAVEELNKIKRYHAGAALLDFKNPQKVIGRLRDPLFSPEESWERQGETSNVVFPTGTAIFGNDLYIYYGAADIRIAVARVNLKELLKELIHAKEES
ncbi:pesticidal protein Cry7Aa [Patescibacteria group bacterium]|nr:pesticidal protein Cry7Aa [Patescibacteria group bacterium]MBU4512123.1 pesticidal protein Cry7Aa [Patescibacteria group bacterium]MCG2692520.1 pesticidal protein Cry7Aa [Candidatus Parcubacteria bacterium]